LPKLENLVMSNAFFDIAIARYPASTDIKTTLWGSTWQLSEYVAIGCKVEDVKSKYEFGTLPVREYTFKFLADSESDETMTPVLQSLKDGSGIYWNVDLTWTTP